MMVFLIGMPGSGKTTFGKGLATELKLPFLDMDALIENREGISVQEIFASKGEDHFRLLEMNCLREIRNDSVVATGGGSPCFHNNMDYMNTRGITVWLETPIAILLERMQSGGTEHRPLMRSDSDLNEHLKEMTKKRLPFYEQAQIHLNMVQVDPLKVLLDQLRS